MNGNILNAKTLFEFGIFSQFSDNLEMSLTHRVLLLFNFFFFFLVQPTKDASEE